MIIRDHTIVGALLFSLALLASPCLRTSAQSSCDNLYTEAVKLQQTMTTSSQRKAIAAFKKAKECYDSQTKQDQCEEQITTCWNIIAQLNKRAQEEADAAARAAAAQQQVEQPVVDEKPAERSVTLTLETSYLKFKAKGEYQKVTVTCKYTDNGETCTDWSVVECPDWASCTTNSSGELVIGVEKNSDEEERSGLIKIACGQETAMLTIIQANSTKNKLKGKINSIL